MSRLRDGETWYGWTVHRCGRYLVALHRDIEGGRLVVEAYHHDDGGGFGVALMGDSAPGQARDCVWEERFLGLDSALAFVDGYLAALGES